MITRLFVALVLAIALAARGADVVFTAPNAAALQGVTPEPGGQLAIVSSGAIAFGFGYNGHQSFLLDGFSILNPQIYGQRLNFAEGHFSLAVKSPAVSTDYLAAKAAYFDGPGGYQFIARGPGYIDNVIDVWNPSGGYSSIAGWHPEDAMRHGRGWAIGMGPHSAGHYGDRLYIATNPHPDRPYEAPPAILVSQEQATPGIGYIDHWRVVYDDQKIVFYGWSPTSFLGPHALTINPDGSLEGPTIAALHARIAALEARLESALAHLRAVGTEP